jgi:hypothetical protein
MSIMKLDNNCQNVSKILYLEYTSLTRDVVISKLSNHMIQLREVLALGPRRLLLLYDEPVKVH